MCSFFCFNLNLRQQLTYLTIKCNLYLADICLRTVILSERAYKSIASLLTVLVDSNI